MSLGELSNGTVVGEAVPDEQGPAVFSSSEAGPSPAYVAALRGGVDADGRLLVRPVEAVLRGGLEDAVLGGLPGGYGPRASGVVAGRDVRERSSRAQGAQKYIGERAQSR